MRIWKGSIVIENICHPHDSRHLKLPVELFDCLKRVFNNDFTVLLLCEPVNVLASILFTTKGKQELNEHKLYYTIASYSVIISPFSNANSIPDVESVLYCLRKNRIETKGYIIYKDAWADTVILDVSNPNRICSQYCDKDPLKFCETSARGKSL